MQLLWKIPTVFSTYKNTWPILWTKTLWLQGPCAAILGISEEVGLIIERFKEKRQNKC